MKGLHYPGKNLAEVHFFSYLKNVLKKIKALANHSDLVVKVIVLKVLTKL